jgi:hypothetical protein
LGAGVKNIAASVTSQFAVLFSVALIVGSTLGYIFGKTLIEFSYTYHMPINISGVTIAIVIMILVLFTTVSTQIRKVVKDNPVNGLKME